MTAGVATTAPEVVSGGYLQKIRDFGTQAATQIRQTVGELKVAIPEKAKSWSISIGQAGKNVADSLDPMYRGISETLQLLDTREKTDAVARPGLTAVNNAVSFLDLAWALKSVQYFSGAVSNGERTFKQDRAEKQYWAMATQIALLVARSISTLHWFVRQKLVDLDNVAQKAMAFGGTRAFNVINAIKDSKLMSWAFAVGFVGLLRSDIAGMYTGEKKVHHMFSAMSTLSYIALMVLSAKKFASPGALAYLGAQAAITGFAAYLANKN